jgi:VWFA-related protein
MKIRARRSLILVALAGLPPAAQQEYRLRVTVNLVQVDAVVTDSHGKPVSDLKSDDFQVLLDGKPQTIAVFNFIEAGGPAPPAAAPRQPAVPRKLEAARPPEPTAPIKREEVRRSVVLFVDDLSMSAETVPRVRAGLRKFIERQLQPGDLAAIVRASAGLGALQDFTTDRNLLLAAANHLRWNPSGRGEAEAYQVQVNPAELAALNTPLGSLESISRVENYTVATASSLWRLMHGMTSLPGRKSVVILSDTLPIRTPDEIGPWGTREAGSGTGGLILASMRRVVDESVRAGVVLYAIDTRGLNSLTEDPTGGGVWASECIGGGPGTMPGLGSGGGPGATQLPRGTATQNGLVNNTGASASTAFPCGSAAYREGQWGSMFLADETGGFMVTEANVIDAAIERIMSDQSGYYLLGFTPPAEALEPGRDGKSVYHHLKVEVRRPGLHVRSHQGFFGVADQDIAAASPRPELQLAAALESPFQSSGLGMEIQSAFLNARKNESFIRTAVVLDGRDLDLTGLAVHRTGVIHLIVRVFEVSGNRVPGGIDQTLRIDLNENGYERALKYGLIYTALLPVSKPGPYQVRAACRDESTGKIGTAGDFLEVPRLKGLALSGIVFGRSAGVDDHVRPAIGPPDYAPGERAQFTLQIINAPDSPLTIRTRLFRDGAQVYESPAMPVETSKPTAGRAFTSGAIDLPASLEPGDYQLRVEVEDQIPPPHHAQAWQWARLDVAAPQK